MTRQTEWTQEERERAQAVLQNDARALRNRDSSITERVVSPETCREWRDTLAGEARNADMVDTDYSPETVAKHASGRCHHDTSDVGVPLERSPEGGRWTRARMITTESRSGVYHTRVCREFPDSVEKLEGATARKQWRECRECSGRVPEAKPVPEAGGN